MEMKIEIAGGQNIANCYNATYYRVMSRTELTIGTLKDMFKIGLLGFGQEFNIKSLVREGKVYPDVMEVVENNVPVKYYVYNTCCKCDSGD